SPRSSAASSRTGRRRSCRSCSASSHARGRRHESVGRRRQPRSSGADRSPGHAMRFHPRAADRSPLAGRRANARWRPAAGRSPGDAVRIGVDVRSGMRFVARMLLNALGILAAAWLVPGISIAGPGATLLAGAILGAVNALVRPVLLILTFPFTLVTL